MLGGRPTSAVPLPLLPLWLTLTMTGRAAADHAAAAACLPLLMIPLLIAGCHRAGWRRQFMAEETDLPDRAHRWAAGPATPVAWQGRAGLCAWVCKDH